MVDGDDYTFERNGAQADQLAQYLPQPGPKDTRTGTQKVADEMAELRAGLALLAAQVADLTAHAANVDAQISELHTQEHSHGLL